MHFKSFVIVARLIRIMMCTFSAAVAWLTPNLFQRSVKVGYVLSHMRHIKILSRVVNAYGLVCRCLRLGFRRFRTKDSTSLEILTTMFSRLVSVYPVQSHNSMGLHTNWDQYSSIRLYRMVRKIVRIAALRGVNCSSCINLNSISMA